MRCTLFVLSLVALLAFGGLTDASAEGATVAVVDMAKLIRKHPDAQTLDERFKKAQATAKDNWDAQQKHLLEMKGKIETMNPVSPDRRREERRFEQQRVNNEFARKWALASAVDEYVRALERIYDDVVAKVRNYSRLKGIQVVLQKDTSEKIESANYEDFFVKLRLRTVVYAHVDLDITDAVLADILKQQK